MEYKDLLSGVPVALRDELVAALRAIDKNFQEGRWEPSELNGGKLCEVAYCILKGHIESSYPTNAYKPPNFLQACKDLEQLPGATATRSERVQVPRMLSALYEVRNNRGVGHVGGDVNPNLMDATCVLYMSKWVVSELIRLHHGASPDEARAAVEALMRREHEVIWRINGKTRVLLPGTTAKEKALRILHSEPAAITAAQLSEWVEYSKASDFRTKVLDGLHSDKLVEFDKKKDLVHLSPLGVRFVEDNYLNA